MTLDTPDETTGRREAYQLGFVLLIEEIGIREYRQLPIETQAAIAENAGLDVEALMRAMRYLADYHERHAEALREYLANKAKRLQ